MTNNNMYFIANWKMYGNSNSINSINNVIKISKLKKFKKIRIIYCPPYTLLNKFVQRTKKSRISIGAQNCHTHENYGSYTGSISSKMIKNLGCKYVIIGHSENRTNGDTDIVINQKIKSSLKQKLKIIFCVGESLKEKRNNKTNKIIKNQINRGLKGIRNLDNIILAYEPVWSIGTGIIPKIKDLKKQILQIQKYLIKKYRIKNLKILYGGSVNSKNVTFLSQISQINGFLIGTASLKSKNFIDIIKKTIN